MTRSRKTGAGWKPISVKIVSFCIGLVIVLVLPWVFSEWLLSIAKVIVVFRKFLKWSFAT